MSRNKISKVITTNKPIRRSKGGYLLNRNGVPSDTHIINHSRKYIIGKYRVTMFNLTII